MILQILEFIFQDFWHWLGTLILISIIVSPLITYGAVKGIK